MMKRLPKLRLARCLCQLCFLGSLFIALPLQAQESVRNPFQAPPPALTASGVPLSRGTLTTFAPVQNLYPLSFAQAGELATALKELFTGKLGVDKSTNSLIFYGPPAEHERLQELLKSLDVATQQVTLEAKIIALSQENNKSLGINWAWDTIPQRETNETDESSEDSSTSTTYGGNFKFWRGYAFRFN
ncbi:MAG: secretin N-terminal domain-containing protein, partial [Phascolarctobacterium sp.]